MRDLRSLLTLTVLLSAAAAVVSFRVVAAERFSNRGADAIMRVQPRLGKPPMMASDAIGGERMQQYQELAITWMQQYLRIDTTNPPGNELQAAEWFKRIFDAEGIENRIFQYAPGRANIWARIPATPGHSRKRAIILLNHMDVVSSEPAHWRVPPFSAAIVDGSMYARGAQDMKSEGLAQLLVMVVLKRERPPLDRDVIFLATADEEVKDSGTDSMIAHHRDLLEHAEYLITEGGENTEEEGIVKYVSVDVAEKSPFWLHVVAHGQPGHGSRPIDESAPNRLLRALNRIVAYHPEPKVSPLVEQLLREMAPYQPEARAAHFRNIRQAIKDESFRASLDDDDSLNYMLRDSIAVTMFGGSKQTNVIPDEAWANLDVRLLPGEDPRAFLDTLRDVVDDPNVSIQPLDGFTRGNSSPIKTDLYDSIHRVGERYFPGAPVMPHLASGYNESQRYRPLGIVCYGFSPYATTPEEGSTEHADNERIRLSQLRQGFRVLYDVVMGVQ